MVKCNFSGKVLFGAIARRHGGIGVEEVSGRDNGKEMRREVVFRGGRER